MTDGDQPAKGNQPKDLKTGVEEWLQRNGYPLEFRTASIVRKAGYRATQGAYVATGEAMREIDVYFETHTARDTDLHIGHVIECKWSKGKPWVLFCSKTSTISMMPRIAQLIASESGQAALWAARLDERLWNLSLFEDQDMPAFSVTLATLGDSKTNVSCYQTVQSIIGNTVARSRDFARPNLQAKPGIPFIGFPVIVIETELFKAWVDDDTGEMQLEQVEMGQLYWRGSDDWPHPVIVDIVTIGHLETYLKRRQTDLRVLWEVVTDAWQRVQEATDGKVQMAELQAMTSSVGLGDMPMPSFIQQLHQRVLSGGVGPGGF